MRRVRLGASPIVVPGAVLSGLESVRLSGLTNMLDRPVVAELAEQFGSPEAAKWIRRHPTEYAQGIFRGFVVAKRLKLRD